MKLSMENVNELKDLCNPKIDIHMCNLIDTIEAQQQEMETLKAYNRELHRLIETGGETITFHNPADVAEIAQLKEQLNKAYEDTFSIGRIDCLIADKDEQAGQLIQMDTALKMAKYYLTDFLHKEDCCSDTCACETEIEVFECGVRKALAEIGKVLGGKEDV